MKGEERGLLGEKKRALLIMIKCGGFVKVCNLKHTFDSLDKLLMNCSNGNGSNGCSSDLEVLAELMDGGWSDTRNVNPVVI